MSLRRGNDLESMRDEFFADRPIGIGSSMAGDDWEELETTYHRLSEKDETNDISLEELKRITFDDKE